MNDKIAAAMQTGRRIAEETLARRWEARRKRAAALAAYSRPLELSAQVTTATGPQPLTKKLSAGFLVALGDSWFDYPFHDVLKVLDDDYGYDIESAAHRGDRIEAMAFSGGQIDKFGRCLEKVSERGAIPKAILLSGGGNDIVADDFGMLLNSAVSPIFGWNAEIVDGIIGERILASYYAIASAINAICQDQLGIVLPIVVHGYDYLVPDGRGVFGGWPFPGPWLEPGFHQKLFGDLPTNKTMMRDVIDRLHQALSVLAGDPALGNIHYLDLRGTLNSDLMNNAYRASWDNELHPSKQGFEAIAQKFAASIALL